MNADYVRDVHRYAAARLTGADDRPINILHSEDIDPAEVTTDGCGHVVASPLVWRKPCWGRVERFARGHRGIRQSWDKSGERRLSETPCDRCEKLSPGAYAACSKIVDERVRSSRAIDEALDAWLAACGDDFGPSCFTGHRGKLWRAFLQAIVDHGGWKNENDEKVKVEALRLAAEKRGKRNAAANAERQRRRQARQGNSAPITGAYLQALQAERDHRARIVKRLTALSGKTSRDMLWLRNLRDSCDRIADVWWARELLTRSGQKVTGAAIAKCMIANGRSYGLSCASLTSRVHDDLKRIAKFEANLTGVPIWKPWAFST
jgi:hypothetical protein